VAVNSVPISEAATPLTVTVSALVAVPLTTMGLVPTLLPLTGD